ncbi:MAG TPA: hypothetical protein PLQ35_01730 [bacterium]|nr:hypothetical protein [bacterium]HQL60990.1 hypothetical protein [bacterium]
MGHGYWEHRKGETATRRAFDEFRSTVNFLYAQCESALLFARVHLGTMGISRGKSAEKSGDPGVALGLLHNDRRGVLIVLNQTVDEVDAAECRC